MSLTPCNTHPRRALGTVIATACLAVVATLSLPAMAMPGQGGMHGMHAEAMHGGGMPMLGHGRMAEKLLDSVGASAEQRTQIRQLIDAAQQEMASQREAGRALRDQAAKLFAQPNVDAAAAEALRQQMLAQHDTASRRMTQLMLDVSRVLTPEQRKQLAEQMAQRRDMMHRHQQERRALQRPQS